MAAWIAGPASMLGEAAHSLADSGTGRDRVVNEYGAVAGANQTLERRYKFLRGSLPQMG